MEAYLYWLQERNIRERLEESITDKPKTDKPRIEPLEALCEVSNGDKTARHDRAGRTRRYC